jgi:flagellar biosynthetic protein FliQ
MSMSYQAMRMALMLSAPLLLVILAVGLIISIFQAATQINEMTLSFIPKLLALCAVLVLLGPWLAGTMIDYIRELLQSIPQLVA